MAAENKMAAVEGFLAGKTGKVGLSALVKGRFFSRTKISRHFRVGGHLIYKLVKWHKNRTSGDRTAAKTLKILGKKSQSALCARGTEAGRARGYLRELAQTSQVAPRQPPRRSDKRLPRGRRSRDGGAVGKKGQSALCARCTEAAGARGRRRLVAGG